MPFSSLPVVHPADIPFDQLKFLRLWLETGDVAFAVEHSSLTASPKWVMKCLGEKSTRLGRYFSQLKAEESQALAITKEKKKMKLWRMVELCTEELGGQPVNPAIALKCLDMLNKMDGHYAPVKAQVQTQAHIVRFDQHI